MLVLTRLASTDDLITLRVGDDIEITILETHGDQVRIGIKAPREVCVVRTETNNHPSALMIPNRLAVTTP